MKKYIKRKLTLTMVPILFVFVILVFSFFIIGLITAILIRLRLYWIFFDHSPMIVIGITLIVSTIVGTLLAGITGRNLVLPVREVADAMEKVADGDYNIELEVDSINEVEKLQASFNKMVKELSSVETLRSDFISNFSHEFKTPIVSIRGFAKLLQNEDLSQADRDEYIQIIIEESERLTNLSTNILDLTRIETTEIMTNITNYSLDEQIRRVIAMMESKWKDKQINLNVELENIEIYNDQDLLQQVWINLFDNAIKFSYQGGDIDISLKSVDNKIIFKIIDYGEGMSPEVKEHIFDKFYKGDKSHSLVGNGLGLALVKRIVDICDGTINVKSAVDSSSMFTVSLDKLNKYDDNVIEVKEKSKIKKVSKGRE